MSDLFKLIPKATRAPGEFHWITVEPWHRRRDAIPGKLPDYTITVTGPWFCIAAFTELPREFYRLRPTGKRPDGANSFAAYCGAAFQGIDCSCGLGRVGHDPGDEDRR